MDIVDTGVFEHEGTCVNRRERGKDAARRLASIDHAREVTGTAAMTCRSCGISR
jgi:hypothetical protein